MDWEEKEEDMKEKGFLVFKLRTTLFDQKSSVNTAKKDPSNL